MGRLIVRDDVGPPIPDDEGWAADALAPIPSGSFKLYVTRDGTRFLWNVFPTRAKAEAEATRLAPMGTFEVVEV